MRPVGGGLRCRENDIDARPFLDRTRHVDPTAMVRHDAMHDRQTQSGSFADRLGGEKGLEDARSRGLIVVGKAARSMGTVSRTRSLSARISLFGVSLRLNARICFTSSRARTPAS
jgi:hypothetical protein